MPKMTSASHLAEFPAGYGVKAIFFVSIPSRILAFIRGATDAEQPKNQTRFQ
jgi:hypothetical protein